MPWGPTSFSDFVVGLSSQKGWRATPTKEVIEMSVGIVIPSDDQRPLTVQEFGDLSDYQAVVGGYIEAISIGKEGLSFFAHDEAKLIGLDLNRRATVLWWLQAYPMQLRDYLLEPPRSFRRPYLLAQPVGVSSFLAA